jgi:hypothetical protein
VTAFIADLAFPSGVTGPWDFAPFALAAARRASEIGLGLRNLWDIFFPRFQDNRVGKGFIWIVAVSCCVYWLDSRKKS